MFAALAPSFATGQNIVNILVQSSSAAIVAAGITFVLLTGGIDLSVGAVMFLGAAICGKLIGLEVALWVAVFALLAIGPLCGVCHGLLVTRAGLSPFIVTLGTLFFVRGLGLWVSRTRAMNLPDDLTRLASTTFLHLPLPVWLASLTIAPCISCCRGPASAGRFWRLDTVLTWRVRPA
jgi:ribose/xylose/arabinose/galactoside ABC-type transport system permease subunit